MNDKLPESTKSEDLGEVQPGYLGTTPPPGKLSQRGARKWIDRPEQLQNAANTLRQSSVIAIDAEFTQSRPRAQGEVVTTTPRLALIQLAIDEHCFVVDALRLNDLAPLAPVVENPEIIILLHGAGADLRVLSERGLNVAHYFDLEASSRSIFGQHESSLASMLQRAFHVRLDKSLQRTDWTRRPLPSAMIAYAARDAEMTLALYYWLEQHYPWALRLHEGTNRYEPVASWIEPFLRGTSPLPADVAMAVALEKGSIASWEQVYTDCRAALAALTHPMRRTRLLRLIADLSLVQMAPQIEPLLNSQAADERASAIRALSRLGVEESKALIRPLLQDPVQDVRQAAQWALRTSTPTEPRGQWKSPTRSTDGTRSWTVGGTADPKDSEGDNDWKARLRSLMGE